jgi:hypothetical protein
METKCDTSVLTYSSTTSGPSEPARFERWLMKPPGFIYYLCYSLALMMIFRVSYIPGTLDAAIVPWLLVFAMVGAGLLRIFVGGCTRLIYRKWPTGRESVGYAMLLLTGALMIGTVWLELPLHIGFRLAEGEMRRQAEALLAGGGGSSTSAGLYRFSSVKVMPSSKAVRFLIRGAGFMEEEGWTYCPSGSPVQGEDASFHSHYLGAWYRTRVGD